MSLNQTERKVLTGVKALIADSMRNIEMLQPPVGEDGPSQLDVDNLIETHGWNGGKHCYQRVWSDLHRCLRELNSL